MIVGNTEQVRRRRVVLGIALRSASHHVIALAIAVGSSAAPAQSGQPRPLPSRLSDAEFWQFVSASSEPAGTLPSDSWTSNEMNYPNIIARMRAAGDTAGAYLGVGPEQNFSYIASLHPRIAFVVDLRRQSFIQQLMYKAIFELSADRADFVSMLFSKPRPAGLSTTSSIAAIWEAYWPVFSDNTLYSRNLDRIVGQLHDTHGFALDATDLSTLRTVYQAFFDFGPLIPYSSTPFVSARPAPAPFTITNLAVPGSVVGSFNGSGSGNVGAATPGAGFRSTTLTGTVRDPDTGQPIIGVTVRVGGSPAMAITNDSGQYRLTDLPADGAPISVDVSRIGYTLTRFDNLRLDGGVVPRDIAMRPAPLNVTSLYYGGVNFAALTAALDSDGVPRSFLASEDNYRYMKDLQSRNLFLPMVGDFARPTAILGIGNYLRAHGTTLAAFYVSDVEDNLFRNQGWRAFYANVATLPVTPTSVFIRAGVSTCPIAAYLAAVRAGRVISSSDARFCTL